MKLLLGIALYIIGAMFAYIEREYIAFGGECLLLIMPFIYPWFKRAAKEFWAIYKEKAPVTVGAATRDKGKLS